jgi:two-component system, chemotaxis family, CheB/CheR fusion protein
MPLSLPPTAVDHVVELEQVGSLLYDLVEGVKLPPTEKVEDPLRDLLALVSRRISIDFRQYKPTTIMRRIARRMAVTHNTTLRDYGQFLETYPDEIYELVKAFLIKVTGFFRDPEAFDYLKSTVLPVLIDRGRENGRVLRFWSAGCATGEEPYSLALLVADMLGAEMPEWSIRIFATDLDENAINFARRGLYPVNVLKDLPDEYRERFFEPKDQGHRLAKPLRQMVIFGHQDLNRGVPFPRIDLVTCRNLLIYLQPELQQTVLDLFAYSLHQSNGYLFLGKAEVARPGKATFEIVNKKWKIYRCTNGPLTLPSQPSSSHTQMGLSPSARHNLSHYFNSTEPVVAVTERLTPELDIAQLRRFNEGLLRYLPLGVVVIDRSYHILTINGGARRMLGIREVIANDQDFLHTVRGLPYAQVRNAIDTAFREHTTVPLPELELDPTVGGDGRYINLVVMPMQAEPGAPDLVVISVHDATEQAQTRKRLEAVQSEQTRLVNDLSAANKRLGDMNKELQDANEELQAANEELMLTQEELQATNEEFEATNEELQATNEELETNNEELQATNEELQTTNDELTSRTAELQELTREIIGERRRLAEIVELAPFYIMVLTGPSLRVEAFNPRYTQVLAGREITDHPFEEVFQGEGMEEFIEAVREAYHQDSMHTTRRISMSISDEADETAQSYFIHHVIPTHDSASQVSGVVIYSENVTEREAQEPK